MITRNELLGEAVDRCLKELYEYVTPQVEWDDFMQQNKEYSEKYYEWEHNRENHPEWEGKRIDDCIGPRPFEMYYLPKEIMKEICDNYIYIYKMDSQQNLLDIIKILKDYCNSPIIDKYIDDYTDEYGNHHTAQPLMRILRPVYGDIPWHITDRQGNGRHLCAVEDRE